MNTPSVVQQHQVITHNETAASAAAAQSKALVEARYHVAIIRPRDMDACREALLKECRRPSFADVARYNKPIGKGVVGPSIRFAEAAIRCMKNMVVDESVIFDDDEKRIIQVSVTDLEANVPYTTSVTIEKTVERSKAKDGDEVLRQRKNSKGYDVFILRATEDEILNKKNALLSKAIRTLGLRLVPGDLIEECMELVVKTQNDRDAQDPDAAKRKIMDAFAGINVPVDQLKQYVGHDLKAISPKELAELRALHAAIKDGEATWRAAWDERFPSADRAKASDALAAKGDQLPGDEPGSATAAKLKTPPPAKYTPASRDAEGNVTVQVTDAQLMAAHESASAAVGIDRATNVLGLRQGQRMSDIPQAHRPAILTALNDLAKV